MLVYMYQASLYCTDCGEKIREELTAAGKAPEDPSDEYSYDSDDFPKGPEEEGESDSPTHCDGCGDFLETRLTSEGEAYVIEAVQDARARFAVESAGMTPDEAEDMRSHYVSLTEWEPFYDHLDFDGPEVDCARCGATVPESESWGDGEMGDDSVPSFCSEACYKQGPK